MGFYINNKAVKKIYIGTKLIQRIFDNSTEVYVKSYDIYTSLSHVSGLSSNATFIKMNGSATLTFVASSGYALPSRITVTGATYTYNKSTGVVVLSNPTTSVSISIAGDEQWDPSKHSRVGGRIFYVDSSSTNTYKLYTSSGQVITDYTVAGLANAYYYDKSGSSVDKFYVVDNTTHTTGGYATVDGIVPCLNLYWGYNAISVGVFYGTIGKGKTQTTTALAKSDTSTVASQSIFYYIKCMRSTKVNGCNDWYVPVTDEMKELRNSGVCPHMWASDIYAYHLCQESNAYTRVYFKYDGTTKGYYSKTNALYGIAIRSF